MKAKNIISALGLTLAMTLTANAQFSITSCPAHDGGRLLGGISYENETKDFQLTMMNVWGDVVWERSYGGDRVEEISVVRPTSDGGYIIGGRSNSGISNDKSEDLLGEYDFWVVKIDGTGNMEWDRTLGGADKDNLVAIEQQDDGVYVLAGYSNSRTTLFGHSGSDYYMIWMDESGRVLREDMYQQKGNDILTSMTLLNDGSFLLNGYTRNSNKDEYQASLLKVDRGGSAEWIEDTSTEIFAELKK